MIKLKWIAAALSASFLLASPAAAQGISGLGILALDPVAEGNTVLTIKAQGEVERTPDMAVFTVGVTTVGKTASEALRDNASKMANVLSSLKANGFAERDLQTSDLSVRAIMSDDESSGRLNYYGDGAAAAAMEAAFIVESTVAEAAEGDEEEKPKPPVIIGYRVSNKLTARQRTLSDYGKTLDLLVSAGANAVEGPSFQIADPESAIDEARAKAMVEANRKAKLFAEAANMRVVRMVMIDEGRTSGLSSRTPSATFGFAQAMASDEYSPIASGELQISTGVSILFELTPAR